MSEKQRVCVIGAGPAGLCALRYLKAESDKFEPVAYERNLWPGGVWAYTDRTGNDETGFPVHSAMYNTLRINLPKELQEFPGFPYPKEWRSYITRQQCLQYINSFIDFFELRHFIKFHTIVRDVEPLTKSGSKVTKWKVSISDTRKTEEIRTEVFDSVFVCSGQHWNEYIPDIPGKDEYKGIILHSKNYRYAELFDGLDVAILGGFRTAEDIGLQVGKSARKLFLCHRCLDFPVSFPKEIEQRPPFVRMTKTGVVFPDDTELKVDAVIFCTGYRYAFPFLKNDIINIKENRVTPLYKHLVHIKYPSLIFLSVPQHLTYFPLLNQFAKFAVRVIDGRIVLPSESDMLKESDEEFESRIREGMKPKYVHHIGTRMWKLDKDLSTLGQFDPLPPVFEKLLDDIIDERKMNITNAYDFNYEITGSNSYRTLNPSGSKSRYSSSTH